jgi:hypothetical protein
MRHAEFNPLPQLPTCLFRIRSLTFRHSNAIHSTHPSQSPTSPCMTEGEIREDRRVPTSEFISTTKLMSGRSIRAAFIRTGVIGLKANRWHFDSAFLDQRQAGRFTGSTAHPSAVRTSYLPIPQGITVFERHRSKYYQGPGWQCRTSLPVPRRPRPKFGRV